MAPQRLLYGTFASARFSALLVALLALLLIGTGLHGRSVAPVVTHALLGVAMGMTLLPLRRFRGFFYFGGAFALFTFSALWISRYSASVTLQQVALLTGFVFFMHAALVILIALLRMSRISVDELAGAISAYLLLGIAGAFLFASLELAAPGSVRDLTLAMPVLQTGNAVRFDEFLYFSFTCLTTLGFGDLIPTTPLARTFAYLEAVIGQVYLTVLVARLVGMHLAQSRSG